MRGKQDAKNNPPDHGIARNFKSGLRDLKPPLGTTVFNAVICGVLSYLQH